MRLTHAITTFALLVLTPTLLFAQKNKLSPAQSALVSTERAFAQMSIKQGQPEAWIEFFAEDGVIFQPEPLNAKEFMRKRLPTPSPIPVTLNWVPIYGGIAQSGELGFNLGPWKITDNTPKNRPPRHGYFLSVWKLQDNGDWRVVADFGVGVKEGNADHALNGAFVAAWPAVAKHRSHGTADASVLSHMDEEISKLSSSAGALTAYLTYLDPSAHMLRDAMSPIVGIDSMRSYLASQKAWSEQGTSFVLNVVKNDVAKSGDFGYTYGTYEVDGKSGVVDKGHYLHVWRRNDAGNWRIVAGTTQSTLDSQ